jgi:hypothetical protein
MHSHYDWGSVDTMNFKIPPTVKKINAHSVHLSIASQYIETRFRTEDLYLQPRAGEYSFVWTGFVRCTYKAATFSSELQSGRTQFENGSLFGGNVTRFQTRLTDYKKVRKIVDSTVKNGSLLTQIHENFSKNRLYWGYSK